VDRARVDYDRLAAAYDARYLVDPLQGIADALLNLVGRTQAKRILEVGCGTGYWIGQLASRAVQAYAADGSQGMLARAASKAGGLLVAARANALPFPNQVFDLVYVVNAIHHFDDPRGFVASAAELLAPIGALSIIGIDPRLIRRWYLYDYFETARENDLRWYPAVGEIVDWMAAAGFTPVEYSIVQTRDSSWTGRAVLLDPFLKKDSNSMLALLTDDQYEAGLQRIKAALGQAENAGREITFRAGLPFLMVTGFRTAAHAC